MKRFREESSLLASQNNIGLLDEVSFPPLNLPLTKTPELINKIESILQQINASTPSENPKTPEKLKAMNFPISNITIGHWTCDAVYPEDLKAKFYFAKMKIIWESLDFVDATTTTTRLKRKIEISWSDVLSFQASYCPHDQTGILRVELSKRPRFFMETNPHPGKHTQWQHAQDFTQQQSASNFRIHTLHFAPGVLQRNLEKLVSCNSFWSKLSKVGFPTLPTSLYFDIGYGNIYSDNISNSFSNGHDHTISFSDKIFQGGVRKTTETQLFVNYGIQLNSYTEDNSENNIVNPLVNEHYNSEGSFPESEMNDMRDLLGGEAYGNTVLLPQTNEPMYPQVGPYQGYVSQEHERQNMDHTNLDGSFQIQQIDFSLYVDYNYDQYINDINGSVFHQMDIEDEFNGECLYI